MNAPSRLALYGVGLVAIFVASYAVAGAVVPYSVVEIFIDQSLPHGPAHETPAPSPETPAPGSPTSDVPSPDTHTHDTH